MTIRYIDAEAMRSGLDFLGLIETLRREHLNAPPEMERTLMSQLGMPGRMTIF